MTQSCTVDFLAITSALNVILWAQIWWGTKRSLKLIIDLNQFSYIFIGAGGRANDLTNQLEINMQLLHVVLNDK